MPNQALISATVLLAICSTRLFGAGDAAVESQNVQTHSKAAAYAGDRPTKFLKSPRPPFPYWLKREISATRNMKNNAIVSVKIDHGKIVSVVPCCGGNEALSKHLAAWVQSSWVADPRMNGIFTLPIKIEFRN